MTYNWIHSDRALIHVHVFNGRHVKGPVQKFFSSIFVYIYKYIYIDPVWSEYLFLDRYPNFGEEDETSYHCQWSCIQDGQCFTSQDSPSHGDPQLPPDCPHRHPGGKGSKKCVRLHSYFITPFQTSTKNMYRNYQLIDRTAVINFKKITYKYKFSPICGSF